MASVFKRKGETIWIASYQDAFGRWRQKRGRASRAETKRLAKELEDDARRKRLFPAQRTQAPAITVLQARKTVLRSWR